MISAQSWQRVREMDIDQHCSN